MKNLLSVIMCAVAIFIATPSFAFEALQPQMHFSQVYNWDVEPSGHVMIIYHCRIHEQWYASLHDVVLQGFKIMENSAQGFPYFVRYFSVGESDVAIYGYVVKKHPSVYLRLHPEAWGYRWEILATDPLEDGINGNEVPR